MRIWMRTLISAFGLLPMLLNCTSTTAPWLDTEFQYGEVEDPSTVQESVQSTAALGNLYILGQVPTPTRCYRLGHDLSSKGERLTLRIQAKPAGGGACEPVGGYRYTMVVLRLHPGTYDLTVIHEITGAQGGRFTETLTIR
jgi:hypothetical protein